MLILYLSSSLFIGESGRFTDERTFKTKAIPPHVAATIETHSNPFPLFSCHHFRFASRLAGPAQASEQYFCQRFIAMKYGAGQPGPPQYLALSAMPAWK